MSAVTAIRSLPGFDGKCTTNGFPTRDFWQVALGQQVVDSIRQFLDLPGSNKPEDESAFNSIFNGNNLEGWDGKPDAWAVHDGEIWCTGVSSDKNWLIFRQAQPADFVLRLEFRWDKGNSGVQVRSDDLGGWLVNGYQVEVAEQSKNEPILVA